VASTASAGPAVAYEHVTFAYNGVPVIEDITLGINRGERLGILGPNGGGKTTLLRLTLGLLGNYRGRIRVFGMDPDRARRHGLVGYVPQRTQAELAFPLSVRQVVSMHAERGVAPWRRLPQEKAEHVDRMIDLVGISELADRPVGMLSGGQLQRVLVARALAGTPEVLILDEPDVGVDMAGQQRFARLLRTLHDELGLTIMIVSHDLRTIAAGCDRVACLSRTLHSHVAPEGLTPQILAEVFSHDVEAVFGEVHIDAHRAAECPYKDAPRSPGKPAPGTPTQQGPARADD
jgi:zinc transport system ATP-binding protein